MSVKKTASLIIGLVVLGWVILALTRLSAHPQLINARDVLKGKIEIFLTNVSEALNPPRRPPVTTIELEENLKFNLPQPFEKFSQEDWDWFWQLLYGRFTVDPNPGWPRLKRVLTREEIQDMLADYYRQPFGSFDQQQWQIFWQQVLKGKVF